MTTIRLKTLCLSLALVSLSLPLSSCSDDEQKASDAERYPEIEALIQAVRSVETDLSRGFLLRAATPRVQTEFQDNLYKIRAASYLLRDNPRDDIGLMQLHQSYKIFEGLNLVQDDRTLLEGFIDTLRQTLDKLTSLQGTSLDGFGDERLRTLFTQNFTLANDLGDFRALSPAGNKAQTWKVTSCGTRCGNLEYLLAQVEKPGDETWLYSPGMALPDRQELTLTLEGSARGPLVDVQAEASVRRFNVLVSEIGADNTAGAWQDLTALLINFPGGKYAAQFRSFKMELDLSAFRGKSVRVALRLSARDSLLPPERPETQWQLNKFIVQGKGVLSLLTAAPLLAPPATPTPPPPAPAADGLGAVGTEACGGAAAQSFFKPEIEAAGPNLLVQGPKEFVTFADRDPKFIKFSGRIKVGDQSVNKAGQAWVVTPKIDVKAFDKICLSLDSAVWFGDASKQQAEVLVSTDYQGDTAAATWTKVEVPAEMFKSDRSPNGQNLLSLKNLPLSSLLGDQKSFVLGFRYTSDEQSAPWWGIKGIDLTGIKR